MSKSCRWHAVQKTKYLIYVKEFVNGSPMRTANGGDPWQLLIDVNKVAHSCFILPPCRWSQRATSRRPVFRFVLALAEQKSQIVWSMPFIFTIAYFWGEREREKTLLKKNPLKSDRQKSVCYGFSIIELKLRIFLLG